MKHAIRTSTKTAVMSVRFRLSNFMVKFPFRSFKRKTVFLLQRMSASALASKMFQAISECDRDTLKELLEEQPAQLNDIKTVDKNFGDVF